MNARKVDDLFYPNRRVEKIATELGVPSMLLGSTFQAAAERQKVFFHGFRQYQDGVRHWNEAGNRMAADVVAASLCGNSSALAQGK